MRRLRVQRVLRLVPPAVTRSWRERVLEHELRKAEQDLHWRNRTTPALLISGWTAGVSVGLWLAGAHPLAYVALGICALAALIAGVQEPDASPRSDTPGAGR